MPVSQHGLCLRWEDADAEGVRMKAQHEKSVREGMQPREHDRMEALVADTRRSGGDER